MVSKEIAWLVWTRGGRDDGNALGGQFRIDLGIVPACDHGCGQPKPCNKLSALLGDCHQIDIREFHVDIIGPNAAIGQSTQPPEAISEADFNSSFAFAILE